MESLLTEDISRFDPLIEKFASIKEKYGDNYPVILYEPSIHCQENKLLRNLTERNMSIHSFVEFKEASKFVQSLGISFILIVSESLDEKTLIKNLQASGTIYGRAMFDFEEEALSKDLFQDIHDNTIKSLKLKAFAFITLLDFLIDPRIKEDEEEVMMMCSLKDMAKGLQQEFTLILYDPNLNPETKVKLEEALEVQIAESNIFDDFAELYQRVKNDTGIPYHLIFSGRQKAEKIIKEIDDLKGLLGLYIYDDNPQKISNEKVDIQKTLEDLVPKIKEGFRTRSKIVNTFPSFATNFDAIDKSHIYNVHYYLKGLINFQNRKQAKEDFLKLARRIYQDQGKLLERFEAQYGEYDGEKILHWYTRDSPIYKLLNNCLRIASSDSILYSRFVLKDMEKAIREQYTQHYKDFHGLVYRGAYISTEEWSKLEKNIGQEIEMYGFLSTTANQRTAVNFFKGDPQNKIFITIIIPALPELDEQGFADVSQFSAFKGESEILFNIRSRFRILEAKISRIDNRGTKGRHLVLLYGAQSLRKYATKHRPVISVELKLPSDMKCNLCGSTDKLFGFHQKATEVQCIDCLIKNSIPKDTPLFALDLKKDEGESVVKRLKGQILGSNKTFGFSDSGYNCHNCKKDGKEKYYKWIDIETEKHFVQCSDCFKDRRKIECRLLLAESSPYAFWQESQAEWEKVDTDYQVEISARMKHQGQGSVFEEVQKFDLCLEYEKKVMSRVHRIRCQEVAKLKSFSIIGRVSEKCGKYQQALKYLHEALIMSQIIFGEINSWTAELIDTISSVYRRSGDYQKALEYNQWCLDFAKTLHGDKHLGTVSSYKNRAAIFLSLGKYQEALEYSLKVLDITKTNCGDTHPSTASAYNNLAGVYQNSGEHQKAIGYYKQALNIMKAIYGETNVNIATSYQDLALVYESLGEHQQAFEHHNKALNLRKTIYGDIHPNVASSYNNLGLRYQKSGEHKIALEYFVKSLDMMKIVYGEKHSETASLYNNIGLVYRDQGQYQKALEFHKKALDIRKNRFGDQHPDIATSYNNIAEVRQKLGQYQQAFEDHKKALNIWKDTFGDQHPDTATSFHNLGCVCVILEQYQEAKTYLTKSLEICKTIYGEMHSLRASSYCSLASVYQSLRDYKKALECSTFSLEILKANDLEKHPDTATVYTSIGSAYANLGQYQEASPYLTKASEITKAIYGENHPDTATFENNLASMYLNLGQYQQALGHLQRSLDIIKINHGENHPNIATFNNNLAMVYMHLKRDQEALPYLIKALEITKIMAGEKHPQRATFESNLATVYSNLGQHERALEHYLKALRLIGDNHPNAAIIYSNLAAVYRELGQHQKAQECDNKFLQIHKNFSQT